MYLRYMCIYVYVYMYVCAFGKSEVNIRDLLQSFSTFLFFFLLRKGLRIWELSDLAKLADQWAPGIHFSPFPWHQAPGLQMGTAAMPAFYMGARCACQGYVCSKHFDLWAVSLDSDVTFEESAHSVS